MRGERQSFQGGPVPRRKIRRDPPSFSLGLRGRGHRPSLRGGGLFVRAGFTARTTGLGEGATATRRNGAGTGCPTIQNIDRKMRPACGAATSSAIISASFSTRCASCEPNPFASGTSFPSQ